MAASDPPNGLWHRNNVKSLQSNEVSSDGDKHDDAQAEDLRLWRNHAQKVKVKVLQQVQGQLDDLLDEALFESVQPFTQRKHLDGNGKTTTNHVSTPTTTPSINRTRDGKVFMARASLLDELFEISHIRSIYHLFLAILVVFCLSTLVVDLVDQGRLDLEFDLLFFAFGKLGTVTLAWLLMFSYTLVVPYYTLAAWGASYHNASSTIALSLGTGLVLAALQACALGVFPVYVVIENQLPPASRFIVTLEQIRFLMKSYSFIRETVPVVMKTKPKEGEAAAFPTFSSYLYFLFCPTLIYRESYPRNPHIRWDYVSRTAGMILTCLFYGYFILVRLCVPLFRNDITLPLTRKTLVLSMFHSVLPGIMFLLLCFFAFLHCWLNLFAELMRFADRMFYKDWWNATSFPSYYRTWNVVVHDWLYYYGYRDFLRLSKQRFRTAGMLCVFIVSALVHEYAFTMGFGFFYPVIFCLFAVFGVVFNFALNDKRQSPINNIVMWTSLLVGQGVQVCLYRQEYYAQIHCPRTGNGFWELVTPRSWNCSFSR